MPTKTAKTKKHTQKKTPVSKAKPMKMTPKKPATATRRGFMWRLLEEKRAAQKEKTAQAAAGGTSPFERFRAQHSEGFGRFHGPRRKAG